MKTVSGIANTSPDRLSGSISSRILDAKGQSGNVIIDARSQSGMTTEIAERAIVRAYGADRDGAKLQNITIITNEGVISKTRK